MEHLKDFIANKVLLSALFSWFFAQFLKIIIELVKRKKYKTKDFILRAFFGTGGMPSSHSATVTSIAIYIGLKEGFNSSLFALAFVLVFIVIRDATGVRLATGKQAEIINELLEDRYNRYEIEYKKVKEVRGHTPLETFVGAIVGAIVALGIYFIR